MSVACLVGNGLSIAYNPELAIPDITAELISRLTDNPSTTQRTQDIWARAIAHLGGCPPSKDDFEGLLGPLERLPGTLHSLAEVQALISSNHPRDPRVRDLQRACLVIKSLYREGVGHALSIIDERSRGQDDIASDRVLNFVKSVLLMGSQHSDVSFGTLNYDSLLNGMVINATSNNCTDMADGQHGSGFPIGPGLTLDGFPLRDVDNMMEDRCRIYDLHGSVAWWGSPGLDSDMAKFTLSDLRSNNVVDDWRSKGISWSPVVLLTDQKSQRSSLFPFSFAYAGFERRLVAADNWVIVGYSFGDQPVNNMLRRAAAPGSKQVRVVDKPIDKSEFKGRATDVLKSARITWQLNGI